MIDRSQLQERVDRGVAWLNRNKPHWLSLIDFDKLNIDSDEDCILGQVVGGYCRACYHYTELAYTEDRVELGFTACDCNYSCRELEECWIDTIRALQESHKVTIASEPAPAPADVMAIAK
jgi:hypothetical protein